MDDWAQMESLQQYRLGSSCVEKALGILVVRELSVSQQCALAADGHSFLGCMSRSITRSSEVAIIPFLLLRSHTVPGFGCPNARQTLITRSKSEESHQDGHELEHLPCEGRLRN